MCARVYMFVLILKSDPLWCRFLPSLSTAQFFFFSLLFSACSFFSFLAAKHTDRKQKTFILTKNTILNRLFKDNTKKKRITTQDDDACYYYFCYDDERDDD